MQVYVDNVAVGQTIAFSTYNEDYTKGTSHLVEVLEISNTHIKCKYLMNDNRITNFSKDTIYNNWVEVIANQNQKVIPLSHFINTETEKRAKYNPDYQVMIAERENLHQIVLHINNTTTNVTIIGKRWGQVEFSFDHVDINGMTPSYEIKGVVDDDILRQISKLV